MVPLQLVLGFPERLCRVGYRRVSPGNDPVPLKEHSCLCMGGNHHLGHGSIYDLTPTHHRPCYSPSLAEEVQLQQGKDGLDGGQCSEAHCGQHDLRAPLHDMALQSSHGPKGIQSKCARI